MGERQTVAQPAVWKAPFSIAGRVCLLGIATIVFTDRPQRTPDAQRRLPESS